MTKLELLEVFARARRGEIVVTTMGAVRTWGQLSNRPELDFASADSAMGHAADLALGLALAQPARRVICFNGDGSMLMSLGTLATVAALSPPNLILVVLQNGVYEITGGQPLPGIAQMDLAAMARAGGISRALTWHCPEQVETDIGALLASDGPVFVTAHVLPENDGPMRRGTDVPEPFLRESLAESAHHLRKTLMGG